MRQPARPDHTIRQRAPTPLGSTSVRVLITGVTGFAGGYLSSYCAALGHEVHGLVPAGPRGRRPGGRRRPTRPTCATPRRWPACCARPRPDRVVHLAGASSVGRSFAEPLATWDVNLGGTLGLLEALRTYGPSIPALIVTSGEIHGRVPVDELPVTADTPLHPLSPYGASKAAADLAAGQYREAYGAARDPGARLQPRRPGPGRALRAAQRRPPDRPRRARRPARRSRCAWATSTPAATSSTCATWCAPTGCCWSAATRTSSTWPAAARSLPVRRLARGARRRWRGSP